MKYTFRPASIDPQAHAEAVRAARFRRDYGTSDPREAWRKTLATFRRPGRTESEAILLCRRAHPELALAYGAWRPAPERSTLDRAVAQQQWEAAIAAQGNVSRYQAILAVLRERPDLYAALR